MNIRNLASSMFLVTGVLFIGQAMAGGRCRVAVDCNAAQKACEFFGGQEFISCGVWYGCCEVRSPGLDPRDNLAIQCRTSPCGPGCPSDTCIGSGQLGLTNGSVREPVTTRLALGVASFGILTVEVARKDDGSVAYNWWNLGQGSRGWQPLGNEMRTNHAPAVSLVGSYMFVVVSGIDGALYLNQGTVSKALTGWRRMNFQASSAPAISSSEATTAIVARNRQGRLYYQSWTLGQAAGAWKEIPDGARTVDAPAVALTGNYLFVVARTSDNHLMLNQGAINGKFTGWKDMGLASASAASITSSGTTTAVVARSNDGRVMYNWWRLGEAGKGWRPVDGTPGSKVSPAASLVDEYLFLVAPGDDGQIRLNQGTIGQAFAGWR